MQDTIEKRIELAAPVSRVWNALTDFRQFGEWFRVKLNGPFVQGLAVSGQLTFAGYEHLRMEQAMKPTSYFWYTWHPYAVDPMLDYSQETPTLVGYFACSNRVRVRQASEGTLR